MAASGQLSEESSFEIEASKYYYAGSDGPCGLVTISHWSKFIKGNQMIIFSVLDDDSQLCWTFLVDSSLKKLRKSRKLNIRIPRSSVENLICVAAKLVVDVSEDKRSKRSLRHFRLVHESSDYATLEDLSPTACKDLKISQFFDVRPRLQSNIGVEDKDGSMLTFIKRYSLLPAEQSRKFPTAESAVPFEIYQGNSRTAAYNKHVGDMELSFLSQALTQYGSLSLEVRDDGTLIGRVRESKHPDNERSFTYVRADVISSSEPIDDHSPQVDIDLPGKTVTLTVVKESTVVDGWELIISNISDPKETYVFLVRTKATKQVIRIPPVIRMQDVRYTLIVKGLQDIDPEGHPFKRFKVACRVSTWINNSPTEMVQVDLVHEAFNKVAVQIPAQLTYAITRWEITVTKLTNSRNLPHETTPERIFVTERFGEPFSIPLTFQAGCTYGVKLRGLRNVACTCKVKGKRKKRPECTCQMKETEDDDNEGEFEGQTTFRAELTKSEVETFYEKALDYIDEEAYAYCRWIYRNKPLEYFEEILANGGIMKTYEKDSGGDPASPINFRLKGLSFTASVRTGSKAGLPIPISPFGNTRLHVPAKELLEKAPNLYFVDFYCHNSTSGIHHVMLVLTKLKSEADRFCETRLHKLNITDNPFLFRDSSGEVQVSTSRNLFVHVFFTDDLDISRYPLKKNIKPVGAGTSGSSGPPKNRSCTKCNLDHSLPNF